MEFILIVFVAMFFFGGAGGVPTGGVQEQPLYMVAPEPVKSLDT